MDIEKLKSILIKESKRDCWIDSEDFNPMDFSGGNFDDAYYGGFEDGRTKLAQELYQLLEI